MDSIDDEYGALPAIDEFQDRLVAVAAISAGHNYRLVRCSSQLINN